MRHVIKSVIAVAVVIAGHAGPASAKPRGDSAAAACATDANFHPDGTFFAKLCVRFNGDGTCAGYKVITCHGAGADHRK